MKNKYLIALGGLTSVITPVAVISCSCSSKTSNESTKVNPTSPPNGTDEIKETNGIDETEETEEDLLDKIFHSSNLLKIVGNKALLDMSKSKTAEKDREISRHLSSFQKALSEFVDANFWQESLAITNWLINNGEKFKHIKVGFNVFVSKELKFIGYKFIYDEPLETDIQEIVNVYDYARKKYEAHGASNSKYKMTENIEEFNDPDW